MEEGIVPGGGIALFNIQIEEVFTVRDILKKALAAPLEAIISNSGLSPAEIIRNIRDKKNDAKSNEERKWIGFDAINNKIYDLKEAGIIDPLKVVKTAFINAVSVASNYLTIGAAITDVPEKKEKETTGGGLDMGY